MGALTGSALTGSSGVEPQRPGEGCHRPLSLERTPPCLEFGSVGFLLAVLGWSLKTPMFLHLQLVLLTGEGATVASNFLHPTQKQKSLLLLVSVPEVVALWGPRPSSCPRALG